MNRRIRVLLYVVITLSFFTVTQARAEQTFWRHDPATPGNWFANANWSAGVPGFEDRACIYNGGTAVIARGYAKAGQLNIGAVLQPVSAEALKKVQPWPGTGAVLQVGGTNRVKGGIYLSGSLRRPGSYTLARGRLSARNIVVGRGAGSGRFTQVGGINRVEQELKVGDLGRWPLSKPSLKKSLGTYRLRRGLLVTGRTSVGTTGRGRFVQTGGVHKVKNLLAIGGQRCPWPLLEAFPVPIGEIGEPIILDDPAWAGEIVDRPIWPKVAVPLPLPSKGRYALHGGALLADRIQVGGWGLRGPTAEFIQTGGYCNAGKVLRVGCFPFRRIRVASGELELAEATPLDIVDLPEGPLDDVTAIPYPIPSATYRMSGGRLSAGYLSLYGLRSRRSKAQFIQSGGDVSLHKGLFVHGRNAGYTISGGRLSTPVLRIGSRYANSGGRLAISNRRARIEVSQRLSFGAGSRFAAVRGSTIHITGPRPETDCQWPGSTFENFSTDPAALAGLENLTLIFEGGDEFVATFEVAGEDRHADPSGLYDNFALDTLQIGGEDVAMVQLVDLFDNQPDSQDTEALYVRNLFIGAGSSLDPNGLALYCLNDGAIMQLFDVDLDGFIRQDDLAALGYGGGDGGSPPPGVIPEPATLALLVIGGMLCLGRRRRNR